MFRGTLDFADRPATDTEDAGTHATVCCFATLLLWHFPHGEGRDTLSRYGEMLRPDAAPSLRVVARASCVRPAMDQLQLQAAVKAARELANSPGA